MKNDFGYTYNKPFKECEENKQCHTIINIDDDCIELKINDVNIYNVIKDYSNNSNQLIESKIAYSIDSDLRAITTFNTNIKTTSWKAIPHTVLTSNMFVRANHGKTPIVHFDEKTKIKSVYYYHNDLKSLFINPSVTIKRNFNLKERYSNIEAKRQKDTRLGNIKFNNNEMSITLVNTFIEDGNINKITIEPKNYLILKFRKSVNFNEIYKIKRRIDTAIHLLMLTNKRCVQMEFVDTTKNSYTYYDLKNKNNDKSPSVFFFNSEEAKLILLKLTDYLLNLTDDMYNGFLPFLDFDKAKTSIEIQFLEYYRALEFIDTEKRKENGKGKNKLFLIDIMKKYEDIKTIFFSNKDNIELEEEIRSLRNYYSHDGYYIETLPIPTKGTKRYLKVNTQWKYNVRTFIKIIAYLEIFDNANIIIDKSKFPKNI